MAKLRRTISKLYFYCPVMILVITVFAAIVRLKYYGYGSDASGMLESIHILLDTGEAVFFHFPPGFGILAYPLYLLTGNIPFSGVLLSFLSYLVLLFCVFRLSKLVELNSFQSYVIVAIVALNPGMFTETNNGLSEVVYSCLLILTALLLTKFFHTTKPLLVSLLIGLTLGFTYLIRAEVLIVVMLLIGLILQFNKQYSLLKKLQYSSVILVIVVGVVFAYSSYLKHVSGDLAITGKTDDVFFNYGGWVDKQAIQTFKVDISINDDETTLAYIIKNPTVFILRMAYNMMDLIATILMSIWYVLIPFCCLVLYQILNDKVNLTKSLNRFFRDTSSIKILTTIIFIICILPVFSLIVFYIGDRFVIPSSVAISMLIGLFAVYICVDQREKICLFLVSVVFLSIWNPYSILRDNGFGITDRFHGKVFSISNAFLDKQWSVPYRHAIEWISSNHDINNSITLAGQKKGQTMLGFINPKQIRSKNGHFVQLKSNSSEKEISEVLEKDVSFVILNKNYVDKTVFSNHILGNVNYTNDIQICHYDENIGYVILAKKELCK